MQPAQTIPQLLHKLWQHISARRRRQFVFLLGLTLLSSLAEVISLGSILPFMGILTQPEKVFNSPSMAGVVKMLGITSASELVLPLAFAFAAAALAAGSLRLLLLWVGIRLGNAAGAEISIEVYRRTLYQPYSVHTARSSSEVISGITQKVGAATSIMIAVVTVITSAALFSAILATLLAVDPMVAMIAAASFGTGYGAIAWLTRQRLARNSGHIAQEQTRVIKILQEGLGAIRDVILDGSQAIYCGVYRKAVMQLQQASGENSFINLSPRFAMESLGMMLIAVLAIFMNYRPGGLAAAMPILGMLALGAQRLLPLMQQLYGNWSVVIGSRAALSDVIDLLEQPLPEEAFKPAPPPLLFQNSIDFVNVRFRYGTQEHWVLEDINLSIPKGARIGFVGSTGSGKSTMLDMLMGLLVPTQGKIIVDAKEIGSELCPAWQRSIAHVPQNIFLADTTIAENIAFGVPPDQIDHERVRQAAKQARIAEFIENRPEGYSVIVGERGVRLSGGQRQRIGIARALYKQAQVLVFDEATSALDSRTEMEVMGAIEDLHRDLTILIIAHRLTTLRNCDMIVRLENGKIATCSTYDQIMSGGAEIR